MAQPTIQAPDVRRGVSMWQGLLNDPRFRGKEPDAINAMLPRYASFEDAIRQMGGSDAEKTMRLQELYGLPQNYRVEGGRLKEHKAALKGVALGAGLLGGMSALGALTGGAGTAATAGAATTGLTTGAAAPIMTPAAAALSGTVAVPGATGASMAGRSGILGALGKIFGAGDTASRVLDVGRLVAGGASASAQNRQQQAQILAALYNTQANIAKQQTDAAREAQRMEIARAQMGRQMDLTAPTVTAPSFLQGRMGSIQMPTLPASSRDSVMARLSAPIPVYRPPTAPSMGASGAEQALGAAGLITQLLGAAYGGANQQRQRQQRALTTDEGMDMTSAAVPSIMGGYQF